MDQVGEMWEAGEIAVLVQTGTPGEGKRDPDFADAPLVEELAETQEARQIAESTTLLATLGRPFWIPPEVPEERVKILRDAFWEVMHDKKFLSEAERARRPIRPKRGEDLQRLWEKALAAPPRAVRIVKEIMGPK